MRRERAGYFASLSLTLLRLLLAAPLAWIAITRGSGRVAAVIVGVGFVSDVYDGIVARHFGVATANLRRLDSAVDTVFYLAATLLVWRLHPESIRSHSGMIGLVIATLVLNYVVEIWKFGREASYHAYTAKAWGAMLFLALALLLVAGDDRLIGVALIAGVISHTENLMITLRLSEWRHDVPSVFHVSPKGRPS